MAWLALIFTLNYYSKPNCFKDTYTVSYWYLVGSWGLGYVRQGCFEMGFQAVKLLHRQLNCQAADKSSATKTKPVPRVLVALVDTIQC